MLIKILTLFAWLFVQKQFQAGNGHWSNGLSVILSRDRIRPDVSVPADSAQSVEEIVMPIDDHGGNANASHGMEEVSKTPSNDDYINPADEVCVHEGNQYSEPFFPNHLPPGVPVVPTLSTVDYAALADGHNRITLLMRVGSSKFGRSTEFVRYARIGQYEVI